MNIFPTDPSPYMSAAALDDKRLVRQASEVIILLGNVAALQGIPSPYKAAHQPNHKLIRWLLDPEAWRWTAEYARAVNTYYTHIYGRVCACLPHLERLRLEHSLHFGYATSTMPRPETFCNAASNRSLGLDFTTIADVHDAYRQYLTARWATDARTPVWSERSPPAWGTA